MKEYSQINKKCNQKEIYLQWLKNRISCSRFRKFNVSGIVGTGEVKFSITFTIANTNFFTSLHYNGDENYLNRNKTKICKFRAYDNTIWHLFCLRSVSKDFTKYELSKISLNGTIYDFSIDHSSNGKQYIFNIHGNLIKSIK